MRCGLVEVTLFYNWFKDHARNFETAVRYEPQAHVYFVSEGPS